MPCLDMPVEKLMEYKGMNPKPKDFDENGEVLELIVDTETGEILFQE